MLCIQYMCLWVLLLDCTTNDDAIVFYPCSTFTGTGWGYVSDQLYLHSSGNPFVQTSPLLQQYFQFWQPCGCKRINFLTNINDHLSSSRFFPSLLDRQLTFSCPDSNTLLDNKQQQQMEFLRWVSYSSMAGTESSNVLIDVFLFREVILYLPLYLKCNWLLLKWTCILGLRR